MKARLQRWGNDLVLRIPKTLAAQIGLEPDSPVEISLRGNKLVIESASEFVTIYHRGKVKAILSPSRQRTEKSVTEHTAFGMWRDRKGMADVDAYVRNLRKGRLDDL